jgi:mannosyl-oligosaccharide glucosidase
MFSDKPLRISMLWYLGMEGLGGIDLENDEDEDVGSSVFARVHPHHSSQGFEGPIKFSGTSPDLGDFRMRIVDGAYNDF